MWGNFEHVQSYPSTQYDDVFYQAQEKGFELATSTTHTHCDKNIPYILSP